MCSVLWTTVAAAAALSFLACFFRATSKGLCCLLIDGHHRSRARRKIFRRSGLRAPALLGRNVQFFEAIFENFIENMQFFEAIFDRRARAFEFRASACWTRFNVAKIERLLKPNSTRLRKLYTDESRTYYTY